LYIEYSVPFPLVFFCLL